MTYRGALGRPAPGQGSARARLFAGAAIVVILLATLTPGDPRMGPFVACIVCGDQGIADAICNLVLFAPLGSAVVALGVRPSRAVLAAAVLSAFVEAMQATVVPGRDPSLSDVIFNTLGAAAGAVVMRTASAWAWPVGRRRALLATGSVIAACAIAGTTGFMLNPAFEDTPWYGQWTANFGNMERYRGRVLDARIGGRLVPSARLDDHGTTRVALLNGDLLSVRVQSSPPTRRISAIFSVYDDHQSEQLLLGANRTDLDLFVRRRANDFRLVNPPLRFEDALAGVAGGDTLMIDVRRNGIRWCAGLTGREQCRGYTAGAGWTLFQDIGILRRHMEIANAFWMLVVLVPSGFWLRGRNGLAVAVVTTVLTCALIPAACGLVTSPPLEWAGAAGGMAVGAALGAAFRQRASMRTSTSPSTAAATRR